MTLRADVIKLPANCPLGAVSIDALANFDLIVVTGPNAAGKSTLIEPLRKPSVANGTVSCIDDKNNANVPYEARGVQQSITFITSTDLMTNFRDLKEALALAAGTTRFLHEMKLLEQLRKNLSQTNEDDDEPLSLNNLRHQYLQADRNCGDLLLRTEAEYNQIGKRLAMRAGVTWMNLDLGAPVDVRIRAESLLWPKPRIIAGFSVLKPSLTELTRLPVPPAGGACGASCLNTAKVALNGVIKHATKLIPPETAPNARQEQEIVQIAEDIDHKLFSASNHFNALLVAKDVLRQCRLNALTYFGNQHALTHPTENCPVCEGKIDSAKLSQSLKAQVAGEDVEGLELRKKLEEIDKTRVSIKSILDEFNMAKDRARQEHQSILDAIRVIVPILHQAIDWDDVVVGSAKVLKDSCESVMKILSTAPSIEAIEAARTLAQLAETESKKLLSKETALNANLGADQNEFRDLQVLGVALAARHALDTLSWEAQLDKIDADRRSTTQRDLCLAVLQVMATERQTQAASDEKQVVDDSGVQERFTRLLGLLPHHPGLQTLKFCGKEVQLNGVAASNTLSEGQRVLVNIAASIAVVGKVAGTANHLPGWIVFDEPTNGLDEEGLNQIAEYLGSLKITDVPSQIVVATFENEFAEKLMTKALTTGRRVKHVELPNFQRGTTVKPQVRIRQLNP